MTVQEAIEFLKGGCLMLACEYHLRNRCNNDYEGRERNKEEALKIAIKSMKEAERYRALGTVKELKEAREKQVAKKPIEYEDKYYACPRCEGIVMYKWDEYPTKLKSKKYGLPYCLGCGQKLDWSEEDD